MIYKWWKIKPSKEIIEAIDNLTDQWQKKNSTTFMT